MASLKYSNYEYWQERFETEAEFDWLKPYSHFRHVIREYLSPESLVLHVGCGNSTLGTDLFNDGICRITNLDYSINALQRQRQQFPEQEWLCMDMLHMNFHPGIFDVVIEKGTLDVLVVDQEDPWRPGEDQLIKMHQALSGISKALSQEGTFISITWAQPHFRRRFLERPEYGWSVEVKTFGESFHYFVFICKKKSHLFTAGVSFEDDMAAWQAVEEKNMDEISSASTDHEDYLQALMIESDKEL
eukprot:Clim_evm188s157 gene=Clim_evmTU188s157